MVYDDPPSLMHDDDGPTDEDLAALAIEEPLIEAGVALVDAQIRALIAEHRPTPLDLLRVRHAQARLERAALTYRAALAERERLAALIPPAAAWDGPESGDLFPFREAA